MVVAVKQKLQRKHNEWFRTVSLGGRKSCPNCKSKLDHGEYVWSWGEYINAKWCTCLHFCKHCFAEEVRGPLTSHAADCGCDIQLCGRGEQLPEWLSL